MGLDRFRGKLQPPGPPDSWTGVCGAGLRCGHGLGAWPNGYGAYPDEAGDQLQESFAEKVLDIAEIAGGH